MKVALGLKAHSGWAALAAIGAQAGDLHVVDRCRLELIEPEEGHWARQPYHAAENLDSKAAQTLVKRGIASARRIAAREIRGAVRRYAAAGHRVVACAVLIGAGMPDWTVEEILAVHFRMHKAEGELFRDVLLRAADACQLRLVSLPEKRLHEHAATRLRVPAARLLARIAALGKSVGAPWGKDQKDTALAALVALQATEP